MTGIVALACKVFPKVIFRVVRPATRSIPLRIFRALAWPGVAAFALLELARLGASFAEYDRLHDALRPPRGRLPWRLRIWRDRARVAMSRLIGFWPEWFSSGRRAALIRLEGHEESLRLLDDRSRPLVLASLHFGPMKMLYYVLRSAGIPVAVMTWDEEKRKPSHVRDILRICDRESGLEGVPRFFAPGNCWEVVEFLRENRVLLVLMSGGGGRHLEVSDGGVTLTLSAGALKIASIVEASVVPCFIVMGPHGRLRLTLGPPLPKAVVCNARRHREACEQFFRFARPILSASPGQIDSWLLKCLKPCPGPVASAPEPSRAAAV